jgi:DNA-binding NarL/FixJ family response regulator
MTNEDAAAAIFVCLEILNYRRVYSDRSPTALPVGLLRQALEHIEECLGREATVSIRARFAEYGLVFSDRSTCAGTELPAGHVTEPTESGEERLKPANFIPRGGLLARCVKVLVAEGHSQAQIARELRLNRRTVARLFREKCDRSLAASRAQQRPLTRP